MYQVTTKQALTLGSDASQLVIVTGWTKKELVEKAIDKGQYAAVGQLYTPRGLNLLVRNLGANPQITYVIGLTGTQMDKNAGSMAILRSFFTKGYRSTVQNGKDYWVVESKTHKALIDKIIKSDELDQLRKGIKYQEVTSIKELQKVIQKLDQKHQAVTRTAWCYPLEVVESRITPGRLHGHVVTGDTVAIVWPKILQLIRSLGKERPVKRGGKWQEILSLTVVVKSEPFEGDRPKDIPDWFPVSVDDVKNYVPLLTSNTKEDRVKYTYGQRLRSWFGVDQINQVIEKLSKEPDAASAVMSLWDVKDHDRGGSPCLNHLWCRINEGELTLTALFRSNDMFGAWPLNCYGLIALQRHIQQQLQKKGLKLKAGPVITTSLSAHIYEECWEFADRLEISTQFEPDPIGDFEICIDDQELVVNHWNPAKENNGGMVKQYRGSLRKVSRDVMRHNPTIDPKHALYLGLELAKADRCRFSGSTYIQS